MNRFRLVAFDVDGTPMESFSWQYLHETSRNMQMSWLEEKTYTMFCLIF